MTVSEILPKNENKKSIKRALKKMGAKGIKNVVKRHSRETNPNNGETPATTHPLSQHFITVSR